MKAIEGDPRGPDTRGHCALCGEYRPEELRPAPGGAPLCRSCSKTAEAELRKRGAWPKAHGQN